MDELASAITISIAKNITSKTWLKGLSDAVEALQDPDRYGKKFIQSYAKTLVPTIIAQAERTVDPEMQAVYSMSDALKSRIPGLSSTLEDKLDLWGNPISPQMGEDYGWIEKAYTFLSPIYVSEGKTSPIDKELTRLKLGLEMPTRSQNFMGVSIELEPNELNDYIKLTNATPLKNGLNLKQYLDYVVTKDDQYKRLSDDRKETYIRKMVNQAREIGKAKLINKYPILADIAMEWKKQKGIGDNQ